jgi:hypothetical protein
MRTAKDELISLYELGYSMREVAKAYSISVERVRQILRANAPHLIRCVGDTRNNSSGKHSSKNRNNSSGKHSSKNRKNIFHMTLREKLEAIWRDQKCRSPVSITLWRAGEYDEFESEGSVSLFAARDPESAGDAIANSLSWAPSDLID